MGRLDPTTALNIELALWALKTVPEQNIRADRPTVETLMQQKEYRKALYLMEMIPDAPDNSALRYECCCGAVKNGTPQNISKPCGQNMPIGQDDWRPAKAYVEISNPLRNACMQAARRTWTS